VRTAVVAVMTAGYFTTSQQKLKEFGWSKDVQPALSPKIADPF
jgi:hypothetical protein